MYAQLHLSATAAGPIRVNLKPKHSSNKSPKKSMSQTPNSGRPPPPPGFESGGNDSTPRYAPVDDGFITSDPNNTSFTSDEPHSNMRNSPPIMHQNTSSTANSSMPPPLSRLNSPVQASQGTTITAEVLSSSEQLNHRVPGITTPNPPTENNGGTENRTFDAFSFLTIVKTVAEFAAVYTMVVNEFYTGVVTALFGYGFALILRIIGSCSLEKRRESSAVRKGPAGIYAILNILFGTRYGFSPSYKRLEVKPRADVTNPLDLSAYDNLKIDGLRFFGGSETLKVGPRTFTAIAEVIQQGFMFYPILIIYLDFGFGNDYKSFEIVFFAGALAFLHLLCWMISPSANVCYGYVYMATWLSFTIPFLVFSLLSSISDFNETIPISFYSERNIYAWLRATIATVGSIIGVAVYNQDIAHKMTDRNVKFGGDVPAILYYETYINSALVAFELISICFQIFASNLFVFQDEFQEELIEQSRIQAVMGANLSFASWLVLVSRLEGLSARKGQSEHNKLE